jgi:hypothetical protein
LAEAISEWCNYVPWVTWYAPNSPYPFYFGPPYPYTSYLPSFYSTPPELTGIRVKEELIHLGVYPVPPPKETLPAPKAPGLLPPPRPDEKKDDKNGDNPPPKKEEKKDEKPPVQDLPPTK